MNTFILFLFICFTVILRANQCKSPNHQFPKENLIHNINVAIYL